MNIETILQTETDFRLGYDVHVPCVTMIWRGYHTSPAFRASNEQVLTLLKEQKATKVLCDIRYFVLIGATDQAWLHNDWLPRARQAGLRYCAMVTPLFLFNVVAVKTVADRLDPRELRVEYFDSAEAARTWLLQVDVTQVSAAAR